MKKSQKAKYHSSVFFVSNVEESKVFYNKILGQDIEIDFGRCVGFVGGFAIWDRTYAYDMMGIYKKTGEINPKDAELYFEIDDLDLLFDRLQKEKIDFVHKMMEQPWGQRCFRIYDPDEHIIEFAEPMPVVIERLYNQGWTYNKIIKKTMMPKELVVDVISMIDSVKDDEFCESLIAPCGMNCRICIAYFGYTMNGRKRKMKCVGCKPKNKGCAFLKKYCEKLTKNEVHHCYECAEFPCSHLKKLDETYQKRYNMSTIENLIQIRDNGMKPFLKKQEQTYRCPQCGGVVCVHNNLCYSCESKKKD